MAITKVTTPVADFDKSTSLPGLKIPSGDNSNQPAGAAAEQGMIRNDTEEIVDSSRSAIAHYNGTAWQYFAATESPDPIVPLENFNTVLWDGDGGSSRNITQVGFDPDFVWIKKRQNDTKSHRLFDSVRTAGNVIYSDLTNQQASPSNELNAFITDGFNIGNASSVNDGASGDTYVAWCWKAGGAAVPNTNGDVQSNVSANVAGGFSIVKGTGSGSGVQSVGHGLSSAPEFVMVKNINATDSWFCLVPGLTSSSYYMRLNTTSSKINNSGYPTIFADSTTVSVRQNSMGPWGDLIAYCWHSVAGYSKISSYVGNGNTTGVLQELGFEPAFLMFKCVTQSGNWIMIDNKRATSNPRTPHLRANTTGQDDYGANEYVDFTSTGFQPKGVSDYNNNSLGQTYIYMAFATS